MSFVAQRAKEEAIAVAMAQQVDGVPVWVMTAEHLVAIALKTGRAKDYARILQFIEAGALDASLLESILGRHTLVDKWESFGKRFLTPDQP